MATHWVAIPHLTHEQHHRAPALNVRREGLCTWHETIEAIEEKIATIPGTVRVMTVPDAARGTDDPAAVDRSGDHRRGTVPGETGVK